MTSSESAQNTGATPVKVLLVDDSAIVRGLMSRALQQDQEIRVVASASDGLMATKVITQHEVDVIILDIEMPKMDGLTALPQLRELAPHAHVIMASTLSQRNAEISLKALSMGASDYVPKPSSREDAGAIDDFYRELRDKVKALGRSAVKQAQPVADEKKIVRAASSSGAVRGAVVRSATLATPTLGATSYPSQPVHAIGIASSTGGPQALAKVLTAVGQQLTGVPVFITQHMPAKFTALLAEHLAKDARITCVEAADGQQVQPGVVYIAPGDYHMQVRRGPTGVVIALNQEPPVNFCRPAADPMFESLCDMYQGRLLGVVLTGMGSDGLGGARKIVSVGGTIVAQDEASSVVWGMPGAVANAKLCSAILPLEEIGTYMLRAISGGSAYAAR